MTTETNIAVAVRKLQADTGLSNAALSKLLRVSTNTIGRWIKCDDVPRTYAYMQQQVEADIATINRVNEATGLFRTLRELSAKQRLLELKDVLRRVDN